MVKKYVKKPITIEAVQWTGLNLPEIKEFVTGNRAIFEPHGHGDPVYYLKIVTLEGDMEASHGDFIIKGIRGEYYPCKPDVFAATYTEVAQ